MSTNLDAPGNGHCVGHTTLTQATVCTLSLATAMAGSGTHLRSHEWGTHHIKRPWCWRHLSSFLIHPISSMPFIFPKQQASSCAILTPTASNGAPGVGATTTSRAVSSCSTSATSSAASTSESAPQMSARTSQHASSTSPMPCSRERTESYRAEWIWEPWRAGVM